jgi:hypothetical protein
MIFGGLLVLFLIVLPRGVVPAIADRLKKRGGPRSFTPQAAPAAPRETVA